MAIAQDSNVLLTIAIRGEIGQLTPALTGAKVQLESLGAQADATSLQLAKLGASAEAMAAKVDVATAASERHTASTSTTIKRMSDVGIAFGAAGVAAGLYSVYVASSFDEAGAHILAGTNTTVAQLAKVKQEAIAMSMQTGQSATSLLQSYYSIASSVSDAAKAQAIWTNAIKFSAAFQTDAITSTGLLTGVTNAYHLSLSQIRPAQDDLTMAVKIGAAEAGDLATAFANVDPIAAHMAVSVKTTGAALADMTNQGLSAAEAGDRWRNLLQQLDAPTAQQVKAVTALGGSYSDLRIKNGDVLGTLQKLNDLMHSATPSIQQISEATGLSASKASIWAQQMSTADGKARMLFGGNYQAALAFFSLMNDGGKQFSTDLQAMARDSGQTEQAFKKGMDNAAADFAKAKQGVNALAIEIGQTLLPQVVTAEKTIVPFTADLANIAKDHTTTTTDIFDISAALLGLSAAVRGGVFVWGGLKPVWDGAKASASGLYSGLELIGAGSVGAGAGIAGLAAALGIGTYATYKHGQAVDQDLQFLTQHRDMLSKDEQALLDRINATSHDNAAAREHGLLVRNLLGPEDQLVATIHSEVDARTKAADATKSQITQETKLFQNRRLQGNQPTDVWATGSGTGSGPPLPNASKQYASLQTAMDALAYKVVQDTQTFGAHAAQTIADTKAYDAARAKFDAWQKDYTKLTAAQGDYTKSLKATQVQTDTLTKLTAQRSKLEAQLQADIAAGVKPSSDLTGHITSLSGEITHIQGVISGLENPVKARIAAEKAAELQTGSWAKSLAAAQAAATKAQNEYLYDKDVLHLHGQALQDAYTKMLAANVALNTLQGEATAAGNALGTIAGAGKIQNIPGLPNTGITSGQNLGYGGTPGTSAANALWVRGVAGSPYAAPAQFSGLPAGALGNGGFGGQSGGGGVTVGGDRFGIPTTAQIKGMPPTVTGAITSIVGAPGTSAVPLPVSIVDVSSAGLNSLRTGTPTQFGQPTTVELKALQQIQSVMSAQGAVDSAKLTVLADTSKMNVDATNAATTAIQDQTSVLQAQAAVGTARSNATIAAINDETAVMSAQGQYAIDSLKSSQTIAADLKKYGPGAQVGLDVHLAAAIAKVDQDAIATAKAKETQDRALGLLSIKISEDGLKAAQDKAKADEVAAKFTQLTDKDRIAVDTANLHIAQDNQQIMLAQLGQLVTLNKGQDDFTNLIAQAGSDNTAAGLATWQLGGDQSASDASAALYGGLMAGDAQQTAIDQNAYATTQGTGDTQLAYLNQRQSQDSTQVSLLQQVVSGLQQVAGNTSSTGAIVTAFNDGVKAAFDAISAMTQTGGIGGGLGLTFNDMLNAVNQAVGGQFGPVALTRNP